MYLQKNCKRSVSRTRVADSVNHGETPSFTRLSAGARGSTVNIRYGVGTVICQKSDYSIATALGGVVSLGRQMTTVQPCPPPPKADIDSLNRYCPRATTPTVYGEDVHTRITIAPSPSRFVLAQPAINMFAWRYVRYGTRSRTTFCPPAPLAWWFFSC